MIKLNRYRIVSNGYVYRIQRRVIFVFWAFIKIKKDFSPGLFDFNKISTLEFSMIEAAERWIEDQTKKEIKFKPVRNKRESGLWKATK